MTHLLEVDSVLLEFGTKRVLQDIYLKSETGKVLGLLGRNGTGKSCLMNIIYGELLPNDKSIRLDGKSFVTKHRYPGDLKYLPQFGFIPKSLSLKRIFKDFKLDFGDFINEFPEFDKYYSQKLSRLSGGERRIVEIYSILVSKTKFCMLDEPFSHIMPIHVDAIKNLIGREKKNKGIIMTDHLYEYLIDICDDLYLIHLGKTYRVRSLKDLEDFGYAKIGETSGKIER